MKFILKNKDVNLNTKIFLYTTAPLQALLWGAESWSLSKTNLNALNVFHHSAIRWILGIKMNEVREKRMQKIEIRKTFGSLQDIDYYVKKRSLDLHQKNCETARRQPTQETPRIMATMPKKTRASAKIK